MKTYLKIKIKSLAAEAVIIKREEQKWKKLSVFTENVKQPHPMFFALRQHRLDEVRTECRSAILAYGYLRGRTYQQIEAKCYEQPNWTKIVNLVSKYGNLNAEKRKEVPDRIKAWKYGEVYVRPVEKQVENKPGIIQRLTSAFSS